MNKIHIGKIMAVCSLSAVLLSSCSIFGKKDSNKNEVKKKETSFVSKKTSYKKDKTTEVLIDSEIKKEDIVKVIKHGDHWHVFTKDGKEHITYTDPEKMGDKAMDLVSVVSKNVLSGMDVVSIKKHGDHWHVYTRDGNEYLTYEDPSAQFPNIRVGVYHGSHGSSAKTNGKSSSKARKVKENLEDKGEYVVKILQHEDHFHIYTNKGNEYISYEDPRSLYPNASFGQYVGSHASSHQISKSRPEKRWTSSPSVSSSNKLKNIGKLVRVKDPVELIKEEKKNQEKVVKILKHEDHYHIYTNKGNEYISYEDPRSKYPDAEFGIYHGSHSSSQRKEEALVQPPKVDQEKPQLSKEDQRNKAIREMKIVNIMGQEPADLFDIVKILKHEDHYHIFDSKGRESICYQDPRSLYPKAYFGDYEKVKKPQVEPQVQTQPKEETPKPSEKKDPWPKNIVRIIDHGDHWHLFDKDGNETVVKTNPKDHYPNAEYIDESKHKSHIEVDDSEIFSYESIRPQIIDEKIKAYMDDNLKKMSAYGDVPDDGKEVYGSDGLRKNVFYWLHGGHYHAISIKQIIQRQKENEFGPYTAKDVVALMKYKIENPSTDLEYKPQVEGSEVVEYLQDYYKIKDSSRIQQIVNDIYIYTEDESVALKLSDFEKIDGKITYNKVLPKILSDKELEEKQATKETEENKDEGAKDEKNPTSPAKEEKNKDDSKESDQEKIDTKLDPEKTKDMDSNKIDEENNSLDNKGL